MKNHWMEKLWDARWDVSIVAAVFVFFTCWRITHDVPIESALKEYTHMVNMREAAAIEYSTRKQYYHSLSDDAENKAPARQDVLDAFREWETWADQVRNHPDYPTH